MHCNELFMVSRGIVSIHECAEKCFFVLGRNYVLVNGFANLLKGIFVRLFLFDCFLVYVTWWCPFTWRVSCRLGLD